MAIRINISPAEAARRDRNFRTNAARNAAMMQCFGPEDAAQARARAQEIYHNENTTPWEAWERVAEEWRQRNHDSAVRFAAQHQQA